MANSGYTLRKLFNDIHLWMGIGSGIILFLVCFTGTVYTFRDEIEALIEPDKYAVSPPEGSQRMPADELIGQLQQKPGGLISSITIPHDETAPYEVSIKSSPEERRGTTYFVDPYTGNIKGTSDSPASGFFMWMFRMHRWLLLDSSIGRPIVGAATLIFVFIILTGLVLWWPKKIKNIKQGLKIKTDANWKRINHDLHNTLGFYSFILLLIMSLTGLCWSFEWYRDGLSSVLGTEVFGGRGEKPLPSQTPVANASPMSLDAFIPLTDELFTYEGDYDISVPTDPESSVMIRKVSANTFIGLSAPDAVTFDQYTGEALKVDRFSDKPLNQQIASLIKPLHMGYVYGTFSKILYFIACLIGTSLPVTGVIIWINKLKKKSKKRKSSPNKRSSVREEMEYTELN